MDFPNIILKLGRHFIEIFKRVMLFSVKCDDITDVHYNYITDIIYTVIYIQNFGASRQELIGRGS